MNHWVHVDASRSLSLYLSLSLVHPLIQRLQRSSSDRGAVRTFRIRPCEYMRGHGSWPCHGCAMVKTTTTPMSKISGINIYSDAIQATFAIEAIGDGYMYRKQNSHLYSYHHADTPNGLKKTFLDRGMFRYRPPPRFLSFRAFFFP